MSVCCVGDTLQNCTLELATLGDLKLVEKPQPVVLAPHDFCNIKANVKVASTENGIIFGNIGNEISKPNFFPAVTGSYTRNSLDKIQMCLLWRPCFVVKIQPGYLGARN